MNEDCEKGLHDWELRVDDYFQVTAECVRCDVQRDKYEIEEMLNDLGLGLVLIKELLP